MSSDKENLNLDALGLGSKDTRKWLGDAKRRILSCTDQIGQPQKGCPHGHWNCEHLSLIKSNINEILNVYSQIASFAVDKTRIAALEQLGIKLVGRDFVLTAQLDFFALQPIR